MYHDDVEYAGHAPTENMTVYNVFPPITSTERVSSSLTRSLCLKCCVIKCMCMRISQFPTYGNEEGNKETAEREGKKQEVKEVKRMKDNVGSKKETGR